MKLRDKIWNILYALSVLFFLFLFLVVRPYGEKQRRMENVLKSPPSTPFLDRLTQGMFVPGVLAFCSKEYGENSSWTKAGMEWNNRHAQKQERLIAEIKSTGTMTAEDKTATDKFLYSKVQDFFTTKLGSPEKCTDFAEEVNKGQFDY